MPIDTLPIISVTKLTKYYGDTVGVKDISFSVTRGEIFGFLGPNGAGKTTTIRLLLHLLHPTSGGISIFNGEDCGRPVEILKRCGYLPGEFAAYNQMTGSEFLRYAAAVRGSDPSAQQELIDRFKISQGNLNKKIKKLSHGTLQKLGIIQALFHKPELIILDEPTTGLDPLMQDEFYHVLREYQEMGSTILFSSHNLPEVEKICSRVAIIRQGRLVALETLEVLKKSVYRRLELTLRKEVENLNIPHGRLIKKEGLKYSFLIKGDMDLLLKELARLPVEDLLLPEADLEEIFMAYYGSGNDD
ncbi:MAG: ABC transporter ATP-binding protein [bacterium]|nr:ABC transporter ATP-binding protein [bacterium]